MKTQDLTIAMTCFVQRQRHYSARLCFIAVVCAKLSFVTLAYAQPPLAKPGKLVWSDEFEGSRLDYSKWECEVNAFGGGNDELQIYTDRKENVRIENGSLIIEARKEATSISGTQRDYSSGRVRTKHRGDWKYGRFDIRAKLPEGQGVWPAIWMMPTEEVYGTWAASGEIDIMEMKGQEPSRVLGTLHFGSQWPKNRFASGQFDLPRGKFSDDFHIFGLEWREGKMTWLIDNQPYQTMTKWATLAAPFPAPFDQPFHLIINLAVGGRFLGNPNSTTQFPAQLQVDYVRVYE